MTLFAAAARRPATIEYQRTLLDTPDGGVLALDVVQRAGSANTAAAGVEAPFALLVAGLGGGSQGSYVKNMAASLSGRGFRVAVLNMRGCGGSPLRTARLFSAHRGATDDVRLGISHVRKVLQEGSGAARLPVFLVGWSTGGSIVANALADQVTGEGKCHDGPWSSADGGVVLAAPLDQVKTSAHCEGRFASRWLYSAYVARNLVKMIKPYSDFYRRGMVPRWLDGEATVEIDLDMLLSSTRITDIDEAITRRVFGFGSVEEYYREASCFQRLPLVDTPLLLVHAADDPVCTGWVATKEVRDNPNIVLVYTAHGGHLGWQDESDAGQSAWVEAAVADFLGAAAAELAASSANAVTVASAIG